MQTIRKLKNLDQSRQEFVSNVSHELKTPLASIQVNLDSLRQDEEYTAEEAAEAAGTIANELLCRIGPRVPRVYLR